LTRAGTQRHANPITVRCCRNKLSHDMDALGITTKGNKPLRFTHAGIDEQVGVPGVCACVCMGGGRFEIDG
jgi:hypothetical protein